MYVCIFGANLAVFYMECVQESFFQCVQRGDLRYLIELLKKDPDGINAREEVCVYVWLLYTHT